MVGITPLVREGDFSELDRMVQYELISKENGKVFQRKNWEYGDAIAKTGVLGAAVEIVGVAARLETLILDQPADFEEEPGDLYAILNVFLDLANYAIIGRIMMEEKNFRGEKYRGDR